VRANIARYINHACKPNAESDVKPRKRKVVIRAIKNIEPGEEINYDYGTDYFKAYLKPIGCKCDACESKRKKKRAEARAERLRLKARAERRALKKAEKQAEKAKKLRAKRQRLQEKLKEKSAESLQVRLSTRPHANGKANGKLLNGHAGFKVAAKKPDAAKPRAFVKPRTSATGDGIVQQASHQQAPHQQGSNQQVPAQTGRAPFTDEFTAGRGMAARPV
jgi:uncharacterized protein